MPYAFVISPTAEAAIDQVLTIYSDEALLDELNRAFESLMRSPVTALRKRHEAAATPTIIGYFQDYYYEIAFRFLEDEMRLELLDVYVGKPPH